MAKQPVLWCDCGGQMCPHGICLSCSDEPCADCLSKWQLEREAKHEADWQRDVIGPLLGFDEEPESQASKHADAGWMNDTRFGPPED